MTYPLGAIIGYDCEVSVPNGPAVHGFILARWMDQAQPRFDEFLSEFERGVAERAWDEGYGEGATDGILDTWYTPNPYRKETT